MSEALLKLSEFLELKPDYSDSLLHLTRRRTDATACQVLADILTEGRLKAGGPHCLVQDRLAGVAGLPDRDRKKFDVVCFSECPPEFAKVFVRPVSGRSYQPEPFGLYFGKQFLRREGARPVFYAEWPTSKALGTVFDALADGEDWGTITDLFPWVSLVAPGNDWHWEREWRVQGDLYFRPNDVERIICPTASRSKLRRALSGCPETREWLAKTVDCESL